MIKNFILFSSTLLIMCSSLFAQYYNLGQDPASIKWNQIKTAHFQVIFPSDFQKESQRMANLLELSYKHTSKTLTSNVKHVPVILHTQTTTSNAVVLWAPKRMEYYTCPSQHSYAQEWLEQLAIHEYRHVVQLQKLDQGITKGLYYLIGEQAVASILGLYVPLWWIEGDAVCAETGLSETGRGRNPDFEMEIKAYTLAGKKYSYEKAIFGSYKNYIPDYYKIGYLLVANSRKKYGSAIWEETMNKIAKRPYMITPFNNGIKKYYGGGKVKFYKNTMAMLDSQWTARAKEKTYTGFTKINKDKNIFISYRNPRYINDTLILAEKAGMNEMGNFIIISKDREPINNIETQGFKESAAANVGKFVLIDKKGNEKNIFTPGTYYPEVLAANDSLIVWAEKTYDPRWAGRNYAVIKTLNPKKHKAKQLTKGSRYFVPALSHDGKTISVVEHLPSNVCSIVLLNSKNGTIEKRISVPDGYFIMTPVFSKDDKRLVACAISEKGKGIIEIDIEKGTTKTLFPFGNLEMSKPCYYKNYILFTAAYTDIDNIYALDTITGKKFIVTSSRLGAYDPTVSDDEQKMLYSDYTANGYDIAEISLMPEQWKPWNDVAVYENELASVIAKQEGDIINTKNADTITYKVKSYKRLLHAINFHSWAPVSVDINKMSLLPGVSFMSQDKLSNTFTTLGYTFDLFNQVGKYTADVSYRGLYPIIDLHYEYGDRAGYTNDSVRYIWKESGYSAGLRVPLNLSKGKYYRVLQPSVRTTFLTISNSTAIPDTFRNGSIQALDYRLYFFNLIKSSIRDISPRWGQLVDINYRHTPFTGINLGSLFSAEAIVNVPGIGRHHTIRLYGGYQNKEYKQYEFSDIISYPHGYNLNDIKHTDKKLVIGSIDYILPLCYPDLKIGSLAYFKRFRADLFFDYAEGENYHKYFYCSTGIEIYTDAHIMRFLAPFNIGIRYGYKPNTEKTFFEGLFAVDLSGI